MAGAQVQPGEAMHAGEPIAAGMAAEPAFALHGYRALRFGPHDATSENGDYLAHCLVRNPEDLFRHIQRIHLHVARKDPAQAYAGVIDLFIALGSKGRALRERMANEVATLLPESNREQIFALLSTGVAKAHRLGDIPGSVLGQPVRGILDMVQKVEAGVLSRSAVEEAHSLIEDGLLAEARDILENALLADPRDELVAAELLQLYRATRDRQAYGAMWSKLWKQDALPAAWSDGSLEAGLG